MQFGTLTMQLEGLTLSQWEAVLNRVGWPVLIIFAFGFLAVRVGKWLAPRIDKLVDAHLGFVESLKGELKSIDGKVSQTNEKLDDLAARLAAPQRPGRRE